MENIFKYHFVVLLVVKLVATTSEVKSEMNLLQEDFLMEKALGDLSFSLSKLLHFKEKETKDLILNLPAIVRSEPLIEDSRYQINQEYEDSKTNFSQCHADFLSLSSSIFQNWTLSLIDSYGKLPSGVMEGNLMWTGNFDQCQKFESPKTMYSPNGFKGRYCLMSISNENISTSVTTAVCVPRSCSPSDLKEEYKTLISWLSSNTNITEDFLTKLVKTSFKCLPESVQLSTSSIICIILLVLLFGLTAVGTTIDLWKRYSLQIKKNNHRIKDVTEDNPIHKSTTNSTDHLNIPTHDPEEQKRTNMISDILICFSALSNGKAILDTSSRPGQLNCLHGIRVISMTWILLSHSYNFIIAVLANTLVLLEKFNSWPFQVIPKGMFAVDTFFLLSGFLVSYLFLKDRSSFSLKKLGYFYFHRYVRLTPVYMIVIFFYTTLYNFIGDGPYWGYDLQQVNSCTHNWWKNLLYISNFFSSANLCMSWSWYLDNDMQFFLISPMFLVLFKSSKTIRRWFGLAVCVGLLLISVIYTAVIVKIKNYPVMLNGIGNGGGNAFQALIAQNAMMDTIYYKPWTRIGPYIVGSLTAVVLINFGKSKRLFTKSSVIIGWFGATAIALAVVYGLSNRTLTVDMSAFYNSCSRVAWATSVAWVILACLTGNGGIIDKFLSWKFWFPLSRLTYTAYLIHPMIMYFYYRTLRSPLYVTNTVMAITYLGFFMITYGLAFVTSIVIEAPVIKLEKVIRNGFSK